jgi:hypothetical protein
MQVDQNRLSRIQDERMFICIDTGDLYAIADIKIIEGEIWIKSQDGRIYKDLDVLTVTESGDHYRLRTWMKQNLNIEY